MLRNAALSSRPLFAFALVCAAVMSFIMCSEAARVSPITTQVNDGVKHKRLRKLYIPRSQHNPIFTGQPSTQTGRQTGTTGETETSGNSRVASSIIYQRPNPVRFSYNQNSPDNRESPAVHDLNRPASSYQPLSGNSYRSNSVIIRKSSLKEASRPFHLSPSPSQVWDAQNSYIKEEVPRYASPSPFSSQTARYWSAPLPTSRGNYKEVNEPPASGARSKFFGFSSQPAPHPPSVSNSLDAYVIKSIPSPEKLTSPHTDFSQKLNSVSSSELPRNKKFQSYLFKNSLTSGHERVHSATSDGPAAFFPPPHQQQASDSQVYSRFASIVKQRKYSTQEVERLSDEAKPLLNNANVAQYGPNTDHFSKYKDITQISEHPGKDATIQSVDPIPHADFQGNNTTVSDTSPVSRDTTKRESKHANKPGTTVKSIYDFRGFINPTWRGVKGQVSNDRTNPQSYSLDQGKEANIHPSFSPRFSFSRRQASKLVKTLTDDPFPGTLDIVQTKSTIWPFTTGFKETSTMQHQTGDRRPFKNYKRIYGLRGFSTRPLEGAKTVVSEPEKSARVQQGFKALQHRSPQILQQSHVSTVSQNEVSSEDLKPTLKEAGSTDTSPDTYQKRRKIYTLLGFQPVPNRNANLNSTTLEHITSSSFLRSDRRPTFESSPKFEPRTPTKVVGMGPLHSSTSSTVRGTRVKGNKPNGFTNESGKAVIVRPPKTPARVLAVTYADVLGSASFSGVKATTQTPFIPADKEYFPNATTEQKEGVGNWSFNSEDAEFRRDNTSRGSEDHEVEDVKEHHLGEDVDGGMTTSDLFLDDEGSGSVGFNMSDVFSTNTTKILSEDLLVEDLFPPSPRTVLF
ncbi:flocculation protein FLO11-like [Gymnodraco acuticeps]|uniref:Flocculation protein FLO11-like n=1 Tax=Gymnodraco acuticeps TaxID=8218 RepID=A0A6P8UW93_GYMAC|nr:flocculation protein FLO11-like [Gymnodraco acuticeps]